MPIIHIPNGYKDNQREYNAGYYDSNDEAIRDYWRIIIKRGYGQIVPHYVQETKQKEPPKKKRSRRKKK